MLSTVGLEHTSLISSGLTWKKVSKGSRSISKPARKSVSRGLRASGKPVVDMSVSESEKLGVTVLGCRFSEKAEHVPIKKRRFLLRSPSPPPRTSSPHTEETERLVKSQHNSVQEFHSDLIANCQLVAVDAASANDLGQIVDTEFHVDAQKSGKVNEQLDDNEDFSGISILAAAACSNSLGGDVGYAEAGSGVEESFACEGPEVSTNYESCSSLKGLSKEDLVGSAEISTDGTGSCVSTVPAEELSVSLREDKFPSKGLVQGNNMEGTDLQENSGAVSQNLLSKDDGTVETHEFSLRDDRSHWDLNTVMDAWERPFDFECTDSQTNIADGISEDAKDGTCSTKMRNTEGNDLQKEPGDTQSDVEKTILPSISRGLAHETQELNIQECKLDACNIIEGAICLQGKLLSCKIDNAPKMDLLMETKSLHHQGRASPNIGPVFGIPFENTLWSSTSANGDENVHVHCVTLGSTGSGGGLSLHQVGSLDSCSDYSPSSECGHLSSTCKSEGMCNAASSDVDGVNNMDNCAVDTQMGETVSSCCQFEKQKVTLPLVAFPEKASHEIGDELNENGENAEGISGLHDGQNIPKNVVGKETGQALGTGHLVMDDAVCKSDDAGSPRPSGAFVGGQVAVAVDTNLQHDKVPVHDTAEKDTRMHIDAEETTTKSAGKSTALLGKLSGRGSNDDGYDSDVPQNDLDPVIGIGKTSELQVDYDSQYEDGELRESIEHTWEEFDGEYGEAEHVDYGSDNRDMYSFDAPDHHISKSVQVEGAECKNNLGSEAEPFMRQGNNSQSCIRGFSMTKVIVTGSGKERAAETARPCARLQVSGKDAVNESDTSVKVDKEPGAVSDEVIRGNEIHAKGDEAKYSGQSADDMKMKMSGWDRLPKSHRSSLDKATGVGDCNGGMNSTGDSMDGLDAEDTETRVVGSRTFKRELQSRIEGPENIDMFLRKDRLQGSRFNDVADANPRSERESGSTFSGWGRYSQHIHARGRGGAHFVDSPEGHRGLRRHHSLHDHGPTVIHRPGTQNAATAVSGKVENSGIVVASDGVGPSDHAVRQTSYSSSHDVHRPFKRSRSPVDRDETFGMRAGIRSTGEMSPNRSVTFGRGRYLRHGPRFDGRGPRGRYHGPGSDDCIESSSNYSHHFARREQSFSPIERRGDPHRHRSHTKSRSRSRTRSPRGRNGAGVAGNPGFRHRSRSPSFRSEGRMLRMRSPYQRPGFAADHMVGFVSMPRRHGSPPHNSRWMGDRKDGAIHFREQGYKQRSSVLDKRSPGRFFTRGDRFDFVDSPRKLKPNEYYRSMHPRRFSGVDGGRGGPRQEGSDDDRRKHGYGYGVVHSVRHYDMDGAVKRFNYAIEDGFAVVHNSRDKDATEFHGRGSPKDYSRDVAGHTSDVPRRSREERGPFVYRRDGKFNGNLKSFGMREGDEDVAPRRRRPS